ncbi:MAG: ABC transporter ATP-binding protein [Acidobacteria bacterium]|nr:ABC transporter ATP-binding protein [Acidobacteriota bacterium]
MLRIEDLRASYDGVAEVLHGVSISVAEHEIVTLLGSNGAGKTTVANAVSGLVPFVRGRVLFQGEDIAGLPAHEIAARGIAHVPSGRQVFPDQTVLENLLLGAHAHRKERTRIRRSLESVWDAFPALAGRRSRPAGTLSGGEQQMLSIARGLMAQPRLMILDEPSMGLAPAAVSRVLEVVRDIWRSGTTVLLVEKLARAALSLSHRLYVLELGSVVLEGTAEDLAEDPRVEEAYLGRRAWSLPNPGAGLEMPPGPRAAAVERPPNHPDES